MTEITKNALRGKKKLMFEAMKSQLGNVSASVKLVQISRETHYRWMREDENYKLWIDSIPDICLDFVENTLMKNIQEGNVTAQIFYLKTKGKTRGYIERSEHEVNVKNSELDFINRLAEMNEQINGGDSNASPI